MVLLLKTVVGVKFPKYLLLGLFSKWARGLCFQRALSLRAPCLALVGVQTRKWTLVSAVVLMCPAKIPVLETLSLCRSGFCHCDQNTCDQQHKRGAVLLAHGFKGDSPWSADSRPKHG